jgi:hypothetical protein
MRYHPTTGAYIVCKTADDIPEGFVDNLAKVKTKDGSAVHSPKPIPHASAQVLQATTPSVLEDDVVVAQPPKKAPTKKALAKKSPLEALNVTREEAEAILKEENIEFDDQAGDDEVAALVEELL